MQSNKSPGKEMRLQSLIYSLEFIQDSKSALQCLSRTKAALTVQCQNEVRGINFYSLNFIFSSSSTTSSLLPFLILVYYFFPVAYWTNAHSKFICHIDNHSQSKLTTCKAAYSSYTPFSGMQNPYSFKLFHLEYVSFSIICNSSIVSLQGNKARFITFKAGFLAAKIYLLPLLFHANITIYILLTL